MLDDTLGPALVATLGDGEWAPTIDLHVQFLAPAQPGRLIGRADHAPRPRHRVLSGDLCSDSTIVATAMAVAAIRRVVSWASSIGEAALCCAASGGPRLAGTPLMRCLETKADHPRQTHTHRRGFGTWDQSGKNGVGGTTVETRPHLAAYPRAACRTLYPARGKSLRRGVALGGRYAEVTGAQV